MDGFTKKIRTQQIIWLALCLSMIAYGAFVLFLPGPLKAKQEFIPESMLFAIAGSFAAGSLMVKKFFIIPRNLASYIKTNDLENFANALLIPNIISWALNEAIAIFALISSILTGNNDKSIQLISIAIVIHIICFPSAEKIKNIFEETKTKIR